MLNSIPACRERNSDELDIVTTLARSVRILISIVSPVMKPCAQLPV
jgi:hypothetical protein